MDSPGSDPPPTPTPLRPVRDLKDIRVPRVPVAFSPARKRGPGPAPRPVNATGARPPAPDVRYRVPEPAPAPSVALVPELPSTSARTRATLATWLGRRRTMAVLGLLTAFALLAWHDGAGWLAATRSWRWHGPRDSPDRFLRTAPDWYRQARQRAAAGDFRLALGAVRYALALLPNDAVLLEFEGDMYQSLLEFPEAQACYEQALAANPRSGHARQNLALCRRLNRYHDDPAAHRSTLYGLHRVMLGQQRTAEAVAISRRLVSDHALQQATWQAALDATGLRGKLTLDPDGGLDLDLTGGPMQPDLSLLRDFPLTGLNLAGTGVDDLHALHGLPLLRLNLADTPVHDLTPLRGMPLRMLNLHNTGVVELSALAACPLHALDISRTRVWDLYPLANLPLNTLLASDTPVADLSPVAALPLGRLELSDTRVTNLAPLGSLGLQVLTLDNDAVLDLSPLRTSPLRALSLSSTIIGDLSPLAGMPLVSLTLADCAHPLDLRPLASCPELEHLTLPLRPLNLKALAKLPHLRFVEHAAVAVGNHPAAPPATTSSPPGFRPPVPPGSAATPAR